MQRVTRRIDIPSSGIGSEQYILSHTYLPSTQPSSLSKIYIQASLHADEIPGLLVINHLIKLLDKATQINAEIILVPFANPIGLNQQLLGNQPYNL
jgi:predicted deacylase